MAEQYNFNVTGERRKTLVRAVSEILGEDAVYQGAPTFAFAVEGYVISRNGAITCPDNAAPEDVARLLSELQNLGFSSEESNRLTVEIPREGFSENACGNLRKIIASKAAVLKKALETDSLEVKFTEDKIIFPWFTLHDLDGESLAYSALVTAMCKMAKTQKRVISKEQDVENEKLTMRLFLIRLGFVGNDYKQARKILLRNLSGNSSWKHGRPAPQAEVPYEKQRS
ncbi:MAG: virulence protein [Ruminococcus sp.]|nr:virulence protein [Ruminococcus sp.]